VNQMSAPIKIEVCANSVESAISAQKGAAYRVELCENIYEGGTTPSAATIEIARELLKLKLNVMIRPRGGDFCYSDLEFEIMKKDILYARNIGVDGVVFGILNPDGSIDLKRTEELVKLARPMKVTFHRAFDMTNNLIESLSELISLNIDCLLTSGGKNKAYDGIETLSELHRMAEEKISIMAGSGVNESNIFEIQKKTGITEFHVSLRKKVESSMTYRKDGIFMGGLPQIPEYENFVTDAERVRNLINLARGNFDKK